MWQWIQPGIGNADSDPKAATGTVIMRHPRAGPAMTISVFRVFDHLFLSRGVAWVTALLVVNPETGVDSAMTIFLVFILTFCSVCEVVRP